MSILSGKHILVGITGSVAAYKAVELIRMLRQEGAVTRVVLTHAGQRFLGEPTLQAASGHPVASSAWTGTGDGMDHIALARWADRLVVAPASANILARFAHGLADDLLTTLALVTEAPLLIAPAMNHSMWTHPATQANVALLRARGAQILGPDAGDQACGEHGPGRLREPALLLADIAASFEPGILSGVHLVITAGPTREAFDPVRVLTNRSSGKMGYAMAAAAQALGARVTLVTGPVTLPAPGGVRVERVTTALEMLAAAQAALPAQIFIGTAAVADYRPKETAHAKIKKDGAEWTATFVRNPDILAEIAKTRPRPFMVGFAAETEDLITQGRRKLVAKDLDLIAANRVGEPGYGLEEDDNAVTLIDSEGARPFERAPKPLLAIRLMAEIVQRYRDSQSGS